MDTTDANTKSDTNSNTDGRRKEWPDALTPENISRLYHDEGLTQREVGERIGVPRWKITEMMHDHDIPRRSPKRKPERAALVKQDPDPVRGPYLRWDDYISGKSVYVSQLLAIAAGKAEPADVFGQKVHIQFKNGRRDDLRPENIKVKRIKGNPWQRKEVLKERLPEVDSLSELAKEWDVREDTITRNMERHGLERHYDAERGGWYITESADEAETADA